MIEMLRRAALLHGLLVSLCLSATLEVHLATPEDVRSRLERGVIEAKARQSTIHKLFEEAGCVVDEQHVGRNSANVICALPGESDSTIIVGAHFDFVEHGNGIVDDWSGVALLPSL